jgi:hypothetical protein
MLVPTNGRAIAKPNTCHEVTARRAGGPSGRTLFGFVDGWVAPVVGLKGVEVVPAEVGVAGARFTRATERVPELGDGLGGDEKDPDDHAVVAVVSEEHEAHGGDDQQEGQWCPDGPLGLVLQLSKLIIAPFRVFDALGET